MKALALAIQTQLIAPHLGLIATLMIMGLSEQPIDFHYFDTTSDALSPWGHDDLFRYDSQGQLVVNDPYTSFTDIGQLFDAEASLFQDYQYGFKPAGKRAFYTVVTDEDNAPGVADKTGLLVNSNNQVVTAAQLASFDANNNVGALAGSELSGLKYWQDVNEQVYLKAA